MEQEEQEKHFDKDGNEIKLPRQFMDQPYIMDLYIRFKKGEFDG